MEGIMNKSAMNVLDVYAEYIELLFERTEHASV